MEAFRMTNKGTRQFSISKVLLLVFFPALSILAAYIWSLQFREVIPPFMCLMIIIFVVLIPIELGIILFVSKKEKGKLNLESAFAEHESLSIKKILIASILPILVAILVFSFIAPIEQNMMYSTIFRGVPEYFKLADFVKHYGEYSKTTIMISLVLYAIGNGVLGPIVEELYFRGLLMSHIQRFGKWAPFMISVLFSAYHLFSPWENITRIIACFPFVYCVYKKKNIFIGMVVHCFLNMSSVIMTIMVVLNHSQVWSRA
jgi:membrane protease YdiL (CAAX protease family)